MDSGPQTGVHSNCESIYAEEGPKMGQEVLAPASIGSALLGGTDGHSLSFCPTATINIPNLW